jgi:molybdate transport system ATP-binding protein
MLRFAAVELPLAEFVLRVDLELSSAVTAVVGPSGSGKTSLLEIAAGFRTPSRGRVEFERELLSDAASGGFVPPRDRRIGYIPQDDTLFPHLSVRGNLEYGAPRVEPAAARDLARVVGALDLKPLLERGPSNLSGGERRRVAIGRALLSRPRLLLCDEPLTGLDRELKLRILEYLRIVRAEFAVPIVYVAHDAEEVRALASEVVALDRGRVVPSLPR